MTGFISVSAHSMVRSDADAVGLSRRALLWRMGVAASCLGVSGVGAVFAQPQPRAAKPAATADELRVLIGKATRLSVLSDRVTRCQVQRSLNVLVSRAERQLEDTRREVIKVLDELAAAGLPDVAQRHLAPAKEAYEGFLKKSNALDVSKPDSTAEFADVADVVGDRVDALVLALVQASGRTTSQVLATTADLQRLTQHAAVHFLLASAGIQPDKQLKEVSQARTDFGAGLRTLVASSIRSDAIDSQIKLLEPQWLLMSTALTHPGRDLRTMENICTTSERLLEVSTTLYGLYDGALKG
jgi:hypothetical protein